MGKNGTSLPPPTRPPTFPRPIFRPPAGSAAWAPAAGIISVRRCRGSADAVQGVPGRVCGRRRRAAMIHALRRYGMGMSVPNKEGDLLMSTIRLSLPVLIAVSLLAVPPAAADPSPGDAPLADSQSFAAEITYLDANRDGRIDARELAAGQQMAAAIARLSWHAGDRNQDGQLTPAEFQAAITAALQSGASADNQAEEYVADAVPLSVLLQQLGDDQAYADELTALREAVEDLDDDDAVITHVVSHASRYPRLNPVLRTWVRDYPVRPRLRGNGHLRPKADRSAKPVGANRARVGPKPARKHDRPPVAKRPGARGTVKPKAGPRPRSGGGRP